MKVCRMEIPNLSGSTPNPKGRTASAYLHWRVKANWSATAELLVDQFLSVFTKDDGSTNMPSVSNKVDKDIPPIVISESGVLKLLREIKVNKAAGPDELPNRVLQECAEEITPAVTAIFQKSIRTGELPKDWRYANVAHTAVCQSA